MESRYFGADSRLVDSFVRTLSTVRLEKKSRGKRLVKGRCFGADLRLVDSFCEDTEYFDFRLMKRRCVIRN